MSEKPRRPRFRFHLLTAIFAVVIVGVFLGANILVRDSVFDRQSAFEEKYCSGFQEQFSMRLYQVRKFTVFTPEIPTYNLSERSFGWPFLAGGIIVPPAGQASFEYCKPGLFADAAVFLCTLFGTLFMSEFMLRRRESRKI